MNKIFVISGTSGSGKTTIIQKIKKMFPEFKAAITFTTRKKRPGLAEDKIMKYISEEKFKQKINKNDFAEWAYATGNYYGTEKKSLEKTLKINNVILNIESIGAFKIESGYPNKTTLIFIKAESMAESVRRLEQRQEIKADELEIRKEKIKYELRASKKYDYVIINRREKLDEAVKKIEKIIRKKLKSGLD